MKDLTRILSALFVGSALFFLTACDNDSELEEAGEEIGDAVEEATDG